jgi:isopentenyl diphosphate isomerase/L-lactate dehydrogenase-like FMN-dependent dehydrogenase
VIREVNAQLRIAMLCSGAANLAELAKTPLYKD